MEQKTPEPIDIFNNGCLYYAHTVSKDGGFQQPRELGFHTIVFYEEFSEQNVVASFRGPVVWGDEKPCIRKLINKETPVEDMQRLCLDTLVSLLRRDSARNWYGDKAFVPGEQHSESVQDYIKRNPNFPISAGHLTLPYFVPLKD